MRKYDQRDWVTGGWWRILIFAGICVLLNSRHDAADTGKNLEDAKMPEFLARDYYDR